MPARKRDLFAEWFAALEELGESYVFRLGRYAAGMPEPEWFFLPHQEYDGIGGLAHVLRTVRGTRIDLPHVTEKRPSWLAVLLAVVRALFRRKSRAMRWRGADTRWRPPERPSQPTAFAWTLFSKEETTRLRAVARARGVSLNAWLLWALTRTLLPELVPGSGSVEWVVPVNMRGPFRADRDTANHAFAIEVAFPADAGPEDVHSVLAEEMARGAHWVGPHLMRWMTLLSPSAIRKAAVREAQVPKQGSFSNMGMFAPSAAASPGPAADDAEEWWMAFNPVLKSRPIGVACLTWRGRLAVTLQVHPALATDPRTAREWLASWRALASPPAVEGRATGDRASGGAT